MAEKSKKIITSLMCNFLLVTIFYGGLLRKGYNADTFTYHVYPQDSPAIRISAGRYVIALFDAITCRIGIRTTDIMPVCIFVSMLFLVISLSILQSAYRRFLRSDDMICSIGYNLGLGLTFCNVLFIEYFMFTEMTIYILFGYILATVGIYLYVGKKKVAAAIIFAVVACTYQVALVYAAIVLAFYYMLEYDFKWSIKAVVEELLGCAIPMVMGVLNMLSIKIVGRISSEYVTEKNLSSASVTEKLRLLWDNCMLFAKSSFTILPDVYLPGIVFVLALVVTIYLLLKSKGVLGVLYYITVITGCLILTFAIPFLGGGYVFQPRITFPLYMIQGLMLVTTLILLADPEIGFGSTKNLALSRYISYGLMAYMWVQMIFCAFITSGRYVSNALDKAYAGIIIREIEKYEEENNMTVIWMCVTTDEYAPPYYDDSKVHYEQINERIMGISTLSMLEGWYGRVFEPTSENLPEVYEKYFAGKDWDYFDVDEQLVIIGDTAYLCVY